MQRKKFPLVAIFQHSKIVYGFLTYNLILKLGMIIDYLALLN